MNRNTSLDGKIIDAAKNEYMEKGYEKASMHEIARKAGVTTGALYTRYKGKDDLFSSLVSESVMGINSSFDEVNELYMDAKLDKDLDKFILAVKEEQRICIELLFKYYDECKMFFCKSDGSSVGKAIENLVAKKVEDTMEYFKIISKNRVDLRGIELIIREQFSYYRMILTKGYTKEDTLKCMQTVSVYIEAGWKGIFERFVDKK